MASLTPAQIELANSLTQDDLPSKLRCAICSKIAINAYRLPCCETAICENCQATLPSSCPVCEHSPVSGADCTIYKSLRTTIRVFLKTKEKNREASRPKPNGDAPPTPVEGSFSATPVQSQPLTKPPTGNVLPQPTEAAATDGIAENVPALPTAESDMRPEAAVVVEGAVGPLKGTHTETPADKQEPPDDAPTVLAPAEQGIEESSQPGDAQKANDVNDGGDSSGRQGDGFGQDHMSDSMNGMSYGGGDMNQMQMMMAMQNGMNPGGFGSFPMMGMGMGMDPMTMQNMMMNGGIGAQGMGMNGMNMGVNGFNGGNNDWGGQQSWNVAQDNFNPNAAAGMGNGDFGNFNSGFGTGYNAGNYGHQNQYNNYGQGNWGFRGRGRGRGYARGYGRGFQQGFNRQYAQQVYGDQGYQDQQYSNGFDASENSGNDATAAPADGETDEFGRVRRADSSTVETSAQVPSKNGEAGQAEGAQSNQVLEQSDDTNTHFESGAGGGDRGMNGSYGGDVPADQYATSDGRTQEALSMPAAASSAPLNAPTGPKAMRQGLPNTSALHLRARGLMPSEPGSMIASPVSGSNAPITGSPVEDQLVSRSSSRHSRPNRDGPPTADVGQVKDQNDDQRHATAKSAHGEADGEREGENGSQPYFRSRSRSRSRSSRGRDHEESRRHKRQRTDSPLSVDDRRDEDDHRRRKHRSRRSTRDEDDSRRRTRDDKHDDRSRSPDRELDRENKRSSHRSHRERDRERDGERDRERDSDRDRRKKSHRSHRDYDREDDRDRDEGRAKERTRDRDRDRDRERGGRDRDREREERDRDRKRDKDRDHRHRSRKASPEAAPSAERTTERVFDPPSGPRGGGPNGKDSEPRASAGGFEIKGASSKTTSSSSHTRTDSRSQRRDSEQSARRASQASAGAAAGKAAKDVHTLEREARDRERLLKEAQRMAGLIGSASAGRKRTRDRDAGDNHGGSRRKSRRSDTAYDDPEERMRRLEKEREGERWD